MCTVTFVSRQGQTIITSNRDEHVLRPAFPPASIRINNKQILYPKDPKAGGTWFATDEYGNVAVLLNGAFVKHQRAEFYRRSRGLIVLDIISHDSPILHWDEINLDRVEPFTLLLFESKKLYQLTWDGERKHSLQLETDQQQYIWSSSTLYPDDIREQRQQLFADFMTQHPIVTASQIMDFHKQANPFDVENGLVINRCGTLKTLTITQAVLRNESITMLHDDLTTGHQSLSELHHLQKNHI